MSVLHVEGVKFGETQMTFGGVAIAALFFFLSRSAPVATLSPRRPAASLFTAHTAATVAGQVRVVFLFCFQLSSFARKIFVSFCL
jgi:cation-transporting ATPase 13A1